MPKDLIVISEICLRLSLRNANLQAMDNTRKTAQKEDKGWNDICSRNHHRKPWRYPSIDGSGRREKQKHAHDFWFA
ncbi:uncharacterized protein LOC111307425 isoform X3 [Durio zibethinus]|uniref:Uncharacterized protein LOC111307425 isoform X3 n=1 Tax=Durio zibethinus TaxID=66656 RepID=A0A6P6A8P1_DURZI|nr:uncharacterized protein LOC111307425 isoform X3 [Durio zibethinus]